MEHDPSKDADLRTLFNSLSLPDRIKLRAAAFSAAMTGIVREDTERHPERFPLYILYLALLTIPTPVPGGGTAAAALVTWGAASLKTEWSRRLRVRLADSLDGEKTVRTLRRFIVADQKNPGQWRVDNAALVWFSSSNSLQDSRVATRAAYSALIGLAKKAP